MSDEVFRRFLGNDERFDLSKPFVDGKHLYFTDGRAVARRPVGETTVELSERYPRNIAAVCNALDDPKLNWRAFCEQRQAVLRLRHEFTPVTVLFADIHLDLKLVMRLRGIDGLLWSPADDGKSVLFSWLGGQAIIMALVY